MLFYLLLIVSSPLLIAAFPQNSNDRAVDMVEVDGFVFDGPVDSGQSKGQQITTSTSTTTTAANIDVFNNCVTNCPVTNEYNPVCGSDNIDYTNPGGLGCAQYCGKDVTLNYYGRCSTAIRNG